MVTAIATVAAALAATAPGGTLAYERDRDISVDGRNLTRSNAQEYAPAWSPDGARLAYVYYRDGNGELYVMKADGSGVARLTRHGGEDLSPAWSPDGARIVFSRDRRIHVMNADGSGVRRLTALAESHSAAWSPDGRAIVFSSSGRTPENPELYSIRPNGTGLKRLTHTKGDAETLGDDGFPSWSPDGRTLVFTSNRTGEGEVWTMRRDGSGERRLAGRRGWDDWWPHYSADGAWIVFESRRLDRVDAYAVRADGTGARLLLRSASSPSWRP
ncbi:MAG: PD40 domain-containing protein [Thermoleophilia bacterium]|nr:PD40 domain-containing protein [Thermoleophilia bacterium]